MHRRPVAVYLAVLAIALQALWPLLAQAKPKSVILVPVCTVEGVTHYLELPGGKTPVEQRSSAHHDHCAFCSFDGERAAVSSFNELVLSLQLQDASLPQTENPSCKTETSFLARPRAPPARPIFHVNNDEFGRMNEEATALLARGACAGDADSGRGILRLGVLLD